MTTNTGMPGYYPAANEHPQSIARITAALATHLDAKACVVYGGQMFTTTGDEEALLQQLLAVQPAAASTPPQSPQPPFGMGCAPR